MARPAGEQTRVGCLMLRASPLRPLEAFTLAQTRLLTSTKMESPDGFSYGPWVLEPATTYSTAEGGGTGDLFGYGFGPQLYTGGALFIKPPSDLQLTVGGATAAVADFSPNP